MYWMPRQLEEAAEMVDSGEYSTACMCSSTSIDCISQCKDRGIILRGKNTPYVRYTIKPSYSYLYSPQNKNHHTYEALLFLSESMKPFSLLYFVLVPSLPCWCWHAIHYTPTHLYICCKNTMNHTFFLMVIIIVNLFWAQANEIILGRGSYLAGLLGTGGVGKMNVKMSLFCGPCSSPLAAALEKLGP